MPDTSSPGVPDRSARGPRRNTSISRGRGIGFPWTTPGKKGRNAAGLGLDELLMQRARGGFRVAVRDAPDQCGGSDAQRDQRNSGTLQRLLAARGLARAEAEADQRD